MAKLQSGTTIYGNANVNTYLTVGTYVSAVGNVYSGSGNYFVGNGYYLTGIQTSAGSSILNGNSNVNIAAANANITLSVSTVGNVLVVTTTGISVSGTIAANGNITGGNILTAGLISSSGNVIANAFIATAPGGTLSGSGNIIGGNIFTGGIVSAAGNVTGNYFIGNGSQLTGIITSVTNVVNGGSNLNIGAANANVTISVSTVGNVAVFTPTGLNANGTISATGNISGGNIVASGNVYGADGIFGTPGTTVVINTSGIVSAFGNIVSGANLIASGYATIVGNVTGGNLLTSGNLSATGNAIAGNILTVGLISSTGNITGGNIATAGNISAIGTVSAGNLYVPGNANIIGNLNVQGNVTFINSNVITTNDLYIELANNQTTYANINNAGLAVGPNGNALTYWQYNTAANAWTTNVAISATSNVIGGNLLTTGYISSTGTATIGNIITSGNVSATGNVYAGNTLITGSESVAGNINTSGNINQTGLGNINGYNGYFSNNLTVIGTFQSTSNITANGAGIFYGNTISGNSALYAGVPGFTPLGSNVVVQIAGNANSYSQINFQNINNGSAATTEIVVTANNGNDVAYFGDFGVAGNNYSNVSPYNSLGTSVAPNDTYLYSQGNANGGGGNLILGSNEKNGVVRIIANGSNTANIVATFANGGVNVTGIVSATGNVTGNYILGNGAFLTGVTTSSNSIFDGNSNVTVGANTNVTVGVSGVGNVATFTPTGLSVTGNVISGNIATTGTVSATGNIAGNYFIGNGSQLTGIIASAGASITNGNSNVTVNANANVTMSVSGVGNVVVVSPTGEYVTGEVSATGNVTGNFIYGNGYYLTGISGGGGSSNTIYSGQSNVNISGANANITLSVSGVGNVAVVTPTGLSVTGNIYGNAFVYSGSGGGISAPGNIIGGNILTGGFVSATGNVYGNYFIGNGSQLVGVTASVGTFANGTSNIAIASQDANVTVSVSGVGNVAVFTPTSINITGNITATGNIVAGGVRSTSSASAPLNPTTGDFWYNTSTNVQYRFTFDGTNYYWIDDFGATATTQPLYTGPILFNDVSTQTNGRKGVFALKNNQSNVAGVANSKQLQVIVNGAVQTPFVNTWVWPFWCVDVSFKGFKVTTLGYTNTANSVVLYRPPAKGSQVSITQVNTATDSQLLRYPFSATTIAISDD
jgi:hypothetical protein